MVTESIMTWVFWYLSYIMSSYKHRNVKCVGNNHPLIVLNTIGCIFTLVYGYRKYHKMGVLIFILHYFLVQHWNVECVWCNHPFILHLWVVFYILVYWLILDVLILVVFYTLVYWLIKVSWNGFIAINPVLCPRRCLGSIQLSSTKYDCTWT